MATFRLWTPNDTYRGKKQADTASEALFKFHQEDRSAEDMFPDAFGDKRQLEYDSEFDAIIWPSDKIKEKLGGVDEWRIEKVD